MVHGGEGFQGREWVVFTERPRALRCRRRRTIVVSVVAVSAVMLRPTAVMQGMRVVGAEVLVIDLTDIRGGMRDTPCTGMMRPRTVHRQSIAAGGSRRGQPRWGRARVRRRVTVGTSIVTANGHTPSFLPRHFFFRLNHPLNAMEVQMPTVFTHDNAVQGLRHTGDASGDGRVVVLKVTTEELTRQGRTMLRGHTASSTCLSTTTTSTASTTSTVLDIPRRWMRR